MKIRCGNHVKNWFEFQIVRAVSKHEAELKAQAAKMGVESLKAGKSDQSNEVKIAKVKAQFDLEFESIFWSMR